MIEEIHIQSTYYEGARSIKTYYYNGDDEMQSQKRRILGETVQLFLSFQALSSPSFDIFSATVSYNGGGPRLELASPALALASSIKLISHSGLEPPRS